MKIVSLLPSATEIVYALGLGDDLVGVTDECDFPPDAVTKPVVSRSALPQGRPLTSREIDEAVRLRMDAHEPIYILDKEFLRREQPDVILTQDLCRVCAVPSGQVQRALDELGVSDAKVLSLDPHTVEEVIATVEAGERLGVQGVEVLAGRHPGPDVLVDGRRRHPGGVPAADDHGLVLTGPGRGVALEGHAHQIVGQAEGVDDLGRRRQQRDDPHGPQARRR